MTARRECWDLPARDFARRETVARLHKVLAELERVSAQAREEEVHDLRVAIRRFRQALRVFAPLLPKGGRRIARRLRKVMDSAAAVRDLDVGLDLLLSSGASARTALARSMKAERSRECLRMLGEVYLLRARSPETDWPKWLDGSVS